MNVPEKKMKFYKGFEAFISAAIGIAALIVMVIFFAINFFVQTSDNPQNSFSREWKPQWMQGEITDEVKQLLEENQIVTENRAVMLFTAELPQDVEKHVYLFTYVSYSDIMVFVGDTGTIHDELRYSFIPKTETDYGKTATSISRFVPMEDGDAGKYVTILQVADNEANSVVKRGIYYGDKFGMQGMFVQNNYLTVIFSVLLLVSSMVAIIVCLVLRIVMHKRIELLYLAFGIFLAAVWIILNSEFIRLIITSWHVGYDANYMAILFMPLPFLMYLDGVQKHRHRIGFFISEVVYIPLVLLALVLYIFNIYDLHASFLKLTVLMLLQLGYMFYTVIYDVIKKQVADYKYVAFGYAMVCLGAIMQIISYVVSFVPFSGVYLALGMSSLLAMSVAHFVRELIAMNIEKQKAISANQAKSDFLASMSHEIRTPINAIMGMNEMILRTTREKESKEYAQDIQAASEQLLELVNEILDFSKIESSKMELIPVKYSVGTVFKDLYNMIEPRAKEKNLDFQMSVNPEIPAYLVGDDVRVKQVISNILTNAVKYTNEGSIWFKVDGAWKADGFYLYVSVEDTGIGIKPEDIDKLFERFERVELERNRNIEGSGLGLSIACRLLKLMGTKMNVKSEYGKGSCFSFEVKQEVVGEEKLGCLDERAFEIREAHHYEMPKAVREAKILVVDDNAINRKVFTLLLRDMKMQIDEAASGEECLKLTENKKYDIIFMDHMMPGMDGVQTLKKLRGSKSNMNIITPTVALTANALSGAEEMYLELGFDFFLSKPIDADKMMEVLERFLPKKV